METLPRDLGTTLRRLSWHAGWFAANAQKGYGGEAARAEEKCGRRMDELRAQSEAAGHARGAPGLLSHELMDDISAMFLNAAWHAAYVRLGWGRERAAKAAKAEFDQRSNDILESGELSEKLCRHLKWMCWNAAWYCGWIFRNWRCEDDERRRCAS